jgi:hypothetical protein
MDLPLVLDLPPITPLMPINDLLPVKDLLLTVDSLSIKGRLLIIDLLHTKDLLLILGLFLLRSLLRIRVSHLIMGLLRVMGLPIPALRLATALPVMVRLLTTVLQPIMAALPFKVVLLHVKANLPVTAEPLRLTKDLPKLPQMVLRIEAVMISGGISLPLQLLVLPVNVAVISQETLHSVSEDLAQIRMVVPSQQVLAPLQRMLVPV